MNKGVKVQNPLGEEVTLGKRLPDYRTEHGKRIRASMNALLRFP